MRLCEQAQHFATRFYGAYAPAQEFYSPAELASEFVILLLLYPDHPPAYYYVSLRNKVRTLIRKKKAEERYRQTMGYMQRHLL